MTYKVVPSGKASRLGGCHLTDRVEVVETSTGYKDYQNDASAVRVEDSHNIDLDRAIGEYSTPPMSHVNTHSHDTEVLGYKMCA